MVIKKKNRYKNTGQVWDRTIFVDILSEYKPERLGYRDYQFTFHHPLGKKIDGSIISYDQTVRVFNFETPIRGQWAVEMEVKEGNKTFWRNTVHPQNQSEWQETFRNSGISPSKAKRLMHGLAQSYDMAQKAVEDLSLEYHTDRESIDTENWPFTEQIEIVPKFAMQGGYTILFGEPGVGKSILAHNIGLCSAAGIMSGTKTDTVDPIVVYYLSLEMGYVQFRERHNELSKHFRDTIRDNFVFSCPDSFDFTNQRDRSMLYNTLSDIKAKLLIVDGHSYWIGNKDDNKNTDMSDYIVVPLKRLAKELELGVLLLHHSGWNDTKRIRGASVLWAGAEIGIYMESDPVDSNKTTISFKKWRPTSIRKPKPITYTYDPQSYTMRVSGEADFLDKLKPGSPADIKKQIMELTGVQVRQASNKLKTLITQGYLEKYEHGLINRPEQVVTEDLTVDFRNTKRRKKPAFSPA